MSKHVSITQFVDASDVQQSLKCSRSKAYEHLRRAAGRRPSERGMLRVPARLWERYVKETFEWHGTESAKVSGRSSTTIEMVGVDSGAPDARTSGQLKLLEGGSNEKPKIPIPRPRTRPHSAKLSNS